MNEPVPAPTYYGLEITELSFVLHSIYKDVGWYINARYLSDGLCWSGVNATKSEMPALPKRPYQSGEVTISLGIIRLTLAQHLQLRRWFIFVSDATLLFVSWRMPETPMKSLRFIWDLISAYVNRRDRFTSTFTIDLATRLVWMVDWELPPGPRRHIVNMIILKICILRSMLPHSPICFTGMCAKSQLHIKNTCCANMPDISIFQAF